MIPLNGQLLWRGQRGVRKDKRKDKRKDMENTNG